MPLQVFFVGEKKISLCGLSQLGNLIVAMENGPYIYIIYIYKYVFYDDLPIKNIVSFRSQSLKSWIFHPLSRKKRPEKLHSSPCARDRSPDPPQKTWWFQQKNMIPSGYVKIAIENDDL